MTDLKVRETAVNSEVNFENAVTEYCYSNETSGDEIYPVSTEIYKEMECDFNELALKSETSISLKTETETKPDPSKLAWEMAREEDRQRAYAKFEIVKTFISYRMEYISKGFKYSDIGKSFMIKLKNGEVCLEAFNKLNTSKLALPTLITWTRMLRYSGDLEHPYSLLESFRYCGRKSRLDPLLRNRIRELAIDERNLEPSWIYTFLNHQLSMFDEFLPISERTLQIMVRDFRRDIYTKSLGKGKKEVKNKVKLLKGSVKV
ncbi:MAG: hypothetical protein FWG98_11820 [Candidatus Cloacimonetes bacterium]|nr:hypothetical protein [Candidatus Cloacimonadota bacterium]